MICTIRNNFHGTAKRVRLRTGVNMIAGRRLHEWKKALCCADCCCSGIGGLRGSLDAPAIVDKKGNTVEWDDDNYDREGNQFIIVFLYD